MTTAMHAPATKALIVGNWKMHLNTHQASLFLHKLESNVDSHRDVTVVLAPSLLVLQSLSLQVTRRKFRLAAQNCYHRDDGAYTGEVSATMLRGVVDYVIIGHSERRHVFGERDADVTLKVAAAIRNNLIPIVCIGETAQDRSDGETKHVLHDQLTAALANVTSDELARIVIAYEPVWAIGTGDNASAADVAEAARYIRDHVRHLFGTQAADAVKILYGGSVAAANAHDYLCVDGIQGLLVGGASLRAAEFAQIVEQAHHLVCQPHNQGSQSVAVQGGHRRPA